VDWQSVQISSSVHGSPSKVCRLLDRSVVCRVKSGQTAIQLLVDNMRHCLGLSYRRTDPRSLLDEISFYRCCKVNAL